MINYQVHVQNEGWYNVVSDGSVAGTIGENKAIECFRVVGELPSGVGIHAFAHVQDLGWSAGNIQGEDVGSTGLGKHIEAIKIGLFGERADKYNIHYRTHQANLGWMNWSQNGEINGTTGGNNPIQAIQIFLEEKGTNKYPHADNKESYIDLEPIVRAQREAEEKAKVANSPTEETKRANVVKYAQSHLGYVGNGYSIFGAFYNDPNGEWCAYFDRYCFKEAGLSDLIPQTGYCPTAVTWWKNRGRWKNRGYVPKNGDVIYFDYNYNGVPDHTGIVEGSDGKTVTTIEGNTSSPPQVKKKYYNVNDGGIFGYGIPEY